MRRLIIAILAFAATATAQAQRISDTQQQGDKLLQVYRLMTTYYVDALDPDKVVEDAIVKLLAELDPHSYYLSVEAMAVAREQSEGSFTGIGIEFDVLRDTLRVVSVMPNSPSESVGLQPNDRIVEIDGERVIGIDRAFVPKLLRGPKGTTVTLRIMRRGESMNIRIVRDEIPIHSVDASYRMDNGWGYVKVNSFAENTTKELNSALRELGSVEGLVIDLRDNGGGLMDKAIEMCELFLAKGQVVMSIEGRAVGSESYRSRKNGLYRTTPLVVLIDEGSASASEIFSGAIQDWDRGLIVGQTSYGKGLVQRRFPLSDGSSVSITIARYHTPSGRIIQRPYELGQELDYQLDHYRRAYDSHYADSVLAAAPRFETLHSHRTVVGSGGIVPDVVVERDTTLDFRYWNRLTGEGIVNEWINLWLGNNRAEVVREYPTADKYIARFRITDAMIAELDAMGAERGITKPAHALASQAQFADILRATIARKIWDTTAYWRIVNPADATYIRALDLIRNWDRSKLLLQ